MGFLHLVFLEFAVARALLCNLHPDSTSLLQQQIESPLASDSLSSFAVLEELAIQGAKFARIIYFIDDGR